jgi:glycosyltransferase involved in cell wall biosynthesis
MPPPRLSILIPVFNEEATLTRTLDRVEAQAPLVAEIVVVDDCSTDGTPKILSERNFAVPTRVIRHDVNRGKGAAIRSGLAAANGDLLLIQDADTEYNPEDFPRLVEPFLRHEVDVVYGARSFGGHSAYSYWYVLGNRLVTLATNVLFNTYITDMETCYKVMSLELWRALELRSDRFGIEPEITAKLLSQRIRIYEVPVSYNARSRREGKKLTWRDGVQALGVLLAVRTGLWHCPRLPGAAPDAA